MHTPALPFHALLRHPRTGQPIQAIGRRRNGSPIWPIFGGSQPAGDPAGGTGQEGGTGGDPASQGQGGTGQGQQGQGTGQQGGQTGGTGAQDVSQLPEWAQAELRQARADAGRSRNQARQQAADQARTEVVDQIAKALGLKPDDNQDPAKLAAEVAGERAARIAAERRAAVLEAADALDVRGSRLTDSLAFLRSIEEFDPTKDGDKIRAAVEKAAADDATLKRGPAVVKMTGDQPPGGTAPEPDTSKLKGQTRMAYAYGQSAPKT